jgi:hypothetical protein
VLLQKAARATDYFWIPLSDPIRTLPEVGSEGGGDDDDDDDEEMSC